MKKYLKFMAYAMLAVFSIALVSCGDDDDDLPSLKKGSKIEINGKSYEIAVNQTDLEWKGMPEGCIFAFDLYDILSENSEIYTFGFAAWDQEKEYDQPKVGMDITKFGRDIEDEGLRDWGQLTLFDDAGYLYEYISGSLIITQINQSEQTITLKFKNLKMGNHENTYIFNGTILLNLTI